MSWLRSLWVDYRVGKISWGKYATFQRVCKLQCNTSKEHKQHRKKYYGAYRKAAMYELLDGLVGVLSWGRWVGQSSFRYLVSDDCYLVTGGKEKETEMTKDQSQIKGEKHVG